MPSNLVAQAVAPATSGAVDVRDDVPVGVARLRHDHLAHTATLHHVALDGLFVRLGPRFLRVYHRSFVDGPHAVALRSVDHGRTTGFLLGTLDNEAHYRWLARRRSLRLVVAGSRALVVRPRAGVEVARTRLRRYLRALVRRVASPRAGGSRRWLHGRRGSADPLAGPPIGAGDRRSATPQMSQTPQGERAPKVAVLTHVAVDEASRGGGVGSLLVTTFVALARQAGADEVRLVTEPASPAGRLYVRLGWRSLGVRPGAGGGQVEELRLEL